MTNKEIADAARQIALDALTAALAGAGAPLPVAMVAQVAADAVLDALLSGALPLPSVGIESAEIVIVDETAPATAH